MPFSTSGMKIYLYGKIIKDFLLNILFPIKCVGCGVKNEIFCDYCILKTSRTERELDNNIIALFDYRNPIIKKAIWELKYHHKRYFGEKLGQLLYEFQIENIAEMKTYVPERSIFVVPVPISNTKLRIRGYNQSCTIAKAFCDCADKGIFELKDNVIFKKIETTPQAKISNRKQRLENIREVFEIKNSRIVKGRTIIIIDDVTTTGGTLNEIIRVLKKAGAKKVVGFAIAH